MRAKKSLCADHGSSKRLISICVNRIVNMIVHICADRVVVNMRN